MTFGGTPAHPDQARPGATVRAIAESVAQGRVSATETVAAALDRAEAAQAELNAFIVIDRAGAESAAAAIDERRAAGLPVGPLAGVPVAVKDNLATVGLPTTAASRILAGYVSPFDATVVARLKAAGAVVIGKTNLDEFGMGSTGENSAFGPTRNPHDPGRVAGGSSSGSAAAVGAGVVPLALGSDTGGSSRLPAAFCGIVGFKPTYGGLSRYGLFSYASSLDQVGLLGRSVADVAAALGVMAGSDPRDATSVDLEPAGWAAAAGAGPGAAPDPVAAGGDLTGARFGVVEELAGEGFGPDALASLAAARAALESRGAEVVEVSLPGTALAVACYYVIAAAEASSNLARYSGMLYGQRVGAEREGQELVMRATRGALFGREVKRRILLGSFALSAGYYDAYYGRALKVRQRLTREMDAALGRVDALVTPTAPGPAYASDEKTADPLSMYVGDVATCLANLSGGPAVSVPCGTAVGAGVRGLPLGVQLIGRAGADAALLRLAAALEAALA
ncbi:MAG: Asp-tRNA(Asn)/Glu-tRNA(Gln) amidotransferase subunit GatA [Trueperaceae bacterium]|nr:Asp-tRNA(Asn)/Glu-tRNA(Gln) amidotransferase subunit GatA [Trueperaceae bacterium]MCO5174891.1 Asp-tRNA(Asn)/Glu-tRNA(Gln) amidotransferase subunit GatA [Trueperaceae bacterium]